MSDIQSMIKTRVTFALLTAAGDGQPVTVELAYRTDDPLAVTLTFSVDSDQSTTWICGRTLLRDGLSAASGEGDLHISPLDEHTVLINLVSPDGHARLLAPATDLAEFLAGTFDIVSEADEIHRLDIDALIENILTRQGIDD